MSLRSSLRDPKLRVPVLACAGALALALGLGFVTGNWLSAILVALTFFLAVVGVALLRLLIRQERNELLGSGLRERSHAERPREGREWDDRDAPQRSSAQGDWGQRDPAFGLRGRPGRAVHDVAPPESIEQQFRRVVRELRGRHRGAGGLYEIPWLMLLGPSGSGKSELIAASEFDIPAQFAPQGTARGVCGLVVSNDAFLIDAPGSWLTGGAGTGPDDWYELLRCMRASRSKCALNGVIVTVSVTELLGGSARLSELGRELRRRLNEIRFELGVDVPTYVVVTHADQLDGFAETVQLLPSSWLEQAFGWTNDLRRLPEPGASVAAVIDDLARRMDQLLPELLLRQPDPQLQRPLFGFPTELASLAKPLEQWIGVIFARDVHGDPSPFLRGVYLTSARADGARISSSLRRLGLAPDSRRAPEASSKPVFVRQLMFDVVCQDENLALPDSRIGPVGRRAIVGAAALAAVWMLVLWGISFTQNLSGTEDLARRARRVEDARDLTLRDLEQLRQGIDAEIVQASSPVQWLGFNRLSEAADRARRIYVRAFRMGFDRETQRNLAGALRRENPDTLDAVVALSSDLRFLADAGEGTTPDLSAYRPDRARDAQGFRREYAAFVGYATPAQRALLLEDREPLRRNAELLLGDLPRLESITRELGSSMPPLRYEDLGFSLERGDARVVVEGIYTPAGRKGLIDRLLGSGEDGLRVANDRIRNFERRYAARYLERWRAFLMAAPIHVRASAEPVDSPYVKLIQRVDESLDEEVIANAREGDAAPGPGLDWIDSLQSVRRAALLDSLSNQSDAEDDGVFARIKRSWRDWRTKDPLGSEARWTLYLEQLTQVQDAVGRARAADRAELLKLASQVAQLEETPFKAAVVAIRSQILPDPRTDFDRKLLQLLEAPVLDALSFVLEQAAAQLDADWGEKLVEPFSGELSSAQMTALCDARTAFLTTDLAPFLSGDQPRELLRGPGLPLGREFLTWLARARSACAQLQAKPSSAEQLDLLGDSVEVDRVPQGLDVRVRFSRLQQLCGADLDVYEFRFGSEPHAFPFAADCSKVELSVGLSVNGQSVETLPTVWKGPLPLSKFFESGQVVSRASQDRPEVREWRIEYDGMQIRVPYEIRSGAPSRGARPTRPPASILR